MLNRICASGHGGSGSGNNTGNRSKRNRNNSRTSTSSQEQCISLESIGLDDDCNPEAYESGPCMNGAVPRPPGPSDMKHHVFYDILKPLLVCMRVWGLFHTPGPAWSNKLGFVYSCVVITFLWLNFIRYFGMYTYSGAFSDGLFFKLVVHVFVFQTCISASQCFYASRNLPKFLKVWEKLKFHQRGSALDRRRMKQTTLLYAVVSTLFICTNTIILAVWLFTPFRHKDVSGQPFYPAGTKPSISFSVLYLAVHTFMCAAWIYAGFFFVAFCICIRKEFQHFYNDFRSVVDQDGILDERYNIEEFRRRHEDICHLVQAADAMFSVYTLTVYGSNLTKACFVMYHLVTHPVEAPINILTHLYWLCISIGYMYLITIPGAMLNSAAMSPAKILYGMRLKSPHMQVENICQVSVFLTKLYQDHIGFTSYHLFVINRHTIITVAALVVSYILVLLKVGSSLDSAGTLNYNSTSL